MRRTLPIVLCAIACFSACDNRIYDQYRHTPVAGWEKNDTLSFNISKIAKSGKYDMELGLRINNLYPFMGLTLIVEQTIYPGARIKNDTINCKLTDERGNIQGQGISYYQYKMPISEIELTENDSLRINIRHDMKREILPGVSDIGIIISQKE